MLNTLLIVIFILVIADYLLPAKSKNDTKKQTKEKTDWDDLFKEESEWNGKQ